MFLLHKVMVGEMNLHFQHIQNHFFRSYRKKYCKHDMYSVALLCDYIFNFYFESTIFYKRRSWGLLPCTDTIRREQTLTLFLRGGALLYDHRYRKNSWMMYHLSGVKKTTSFQFSQIIVFFVLQLWKRNILLKNVRFILFL